MKSTKKALLLSMMSMLLCVAMLMGTTFAWFTDTVESGTNRIVAGNLDVDMLYKSGIMTEYKTVNGVATTENGSTPFFVDKDGGKILWEPGVMVYTYFDVKNLGTLALRYNFALRITGKNALETNGVKHSLDEVIKAVVLEGEIAGEQVKSSVQGQVWKSIESFTDADSLQPNTDKKFTVVLYWAPTANDDLYNVKNGQHTIEAGAWANQDETALYIDFDIKLTATQLDYEYDSFDNQYDKFADLWKLSTVTPDGRWVGITKGESCILDGTLDPYITVVGADGQPGEIIALTDGLNNKPVGNGTITVSGKTVTYTNTVAAQNVVIRTNSFETALIVDAPSDTVKHYSYASSVDVLHIASASYHENGTVGRVELHDAYGHVEAEDGCEIFCLMNATGAEQTADNKPIVQVNEGAIVHTNDQNKNVASAEIAKEQENVSTKGVANGHFDDCGAGRHSFSQLVVDSEHVYDVCTCCGYTLITVQDQLGNETKQSKNILDEQGKVTEENTTPVLTYQTNTIIDSTPSTEVKNYEIATNEAGEEIKLTEEIEVTKIPQTEEPCEHNFVGTVTLEATCTSTGVKTFVCEHCGASYNVTLSKIAHKFYDNKEGQAYSGTDTCSMCGKTRAYYYPENYLVTVVDGVEYETLADALAVAPTDGTLFKIVLLNDDAIKAKDDVAATQNGYWEIKAGQNVVIDLNGYTLKNLITADKTSQVFKNSGTLTIMDSSDVNKDGTGTGRIFNDLNNGVTPGSWPTSNYATDVINNSGTLIIKSGLLYNTVRCGIGFVVDGYNGNMTMDGGYLKADYTAAVRIASYNSTTPTFNLNDGTLEGVYVVYFDMASYTNVTFNMNGGSVLASDTDAFSLYWAKNSENYKCAYLNVTDGYIGGKVDGNLLKYSNCTFAGGTFGYVVEGGASVGVGKFYIDENGYARFEGAGTYLYAYGWSIDKMKEYVCTNYNVELLDATTTGKKYYKMSDIYYYYSLAQNGIMLNGYSKDDYPAYPWPEIKDLSGYFELVSKAHNAYYDYNITPEAGYVATENVDGSVSIVKAPYCLYYYYTPSSGDPYYWTDYYATYEEALSDYNSYSQLSSVSKLTQPSETYSLQYSKDNGSTWNVWYTGTSELMNSYKTSAEGIAANEGLLFKVVKWAD